MHANLPSSVLFSIVPDLIVSVAVLVLYVWSYVTQTRLSKKYQPEMLSADRALFAVIGAGIVAGPLVAMAVVDYALLIPSTGMALGAFIGLFAGGIVRERLVPELPNKNLLLSELRRADIGEDEFDQCRLRLAGHPDGDFADMAAGIKEAKRDLEARRNAITNSVVESLSAM